MMDARGLPTRVCPECGGENFLVNVVFDDAYDICFYQCDTAECIECGTLITAPTPLDLPEESHG
jgi:uncharacterized Zn finger protein